MYRHNICVTSKYYPLYSINIPIFFKQFVRKSNMIEYGLQKENCHLRNHYLLCMTQPIEVSNDLGYLEKGVTVNIKSVMIN